LALNLEMNLLIKSADENPHSSATQKWVLVWEALQFHASQA